MAQREKDPISREAYREMYHRTQEELRLLREAVRLGASAEDALWGEMEASVANSMAYYKLGRSLGGTYWVRLKWTQGPLASRYAIGGHSTLVNAIYACQDDADRILSGKKTAPIDIGYRDRKK